MNWAKLLRIALYLTRLVIWLAAVVLIGITSSSIRSQWHDVVYVINAAFLLAGGVWIGERVAGYIERKLLPDRDE